MPDFESGDADLPAGVANQMPSGVRGQMPSMNTSGGNTGSTKDVPPSVAKHEYVIKSK